MTKKERWEAALANQIDQVADADGTMLELLSMIRDKHALLAALRNIAAMADTSGDKAILAEANEAIAKATK